MHIVSCIGSVYLIPPSDQARMFLCAKKGSDSSKEYPETLETVQKPGVPPV